MVSPADGKTPAVVKTPPAVTPPPADPLPVPADLTGAAASIFARFAAALRGTIELSDSPVLSAASRHLAEAERCRDEAAKHSPSSTDFGRCHRAGLAAEGAANRILAAFMMTPAGRAKALAEKAATEPMKTQTPVRPEFSFDRVTREWRSAHPGEKFPPPGGEFWQLLEVARAEEAAEVDDRRTPEQRRRWSEFEEQRSADRAKYLCGKQQQRGLDADEERELDEYTLAHHPRPPAKDPHGRTSPPAIAAERPAL